MPRTTRDICQQKNKRRKWKMVLQARNKNTRLSRKATFFQSYRQIVLFREETVISTCDISNGSNRKNHKKRSSWQQLKVRIPRIHEKKLVHYGPLVADNNDQTQITDQANNPDFSGHGESMNGELGTLNPPTGHDEWDYVEDSRGRQHPIEESSDHGESMQEQAATLNQPTEHDEWDYVVDSPGGQLYRPPIQESSDHGESMQEQAATLNQPTEHDEWDYVVDSRVRQLHRLPIQDPKEHAQPSEHDEQDCIPDLRMRQLHQLPIPESSGRFQSVPHGGAILNIPIEHDENSCFQFTREGRRRTSRKTCIEFEE